jgi:hypothetical protein
MKPFFTLLLLTGSSACLGQIARDSEPAAPIVAQVAAAQSYRTSQDSVRTVRTDSYRSDDQVYICDSQTANAYHSNQSCRGLNRCTHAVVKVTKKEAEEKYDRVKCQMCY